MRMDGSNPFVLDVPSPHDQVAISGGRIFAGGGYLDLATHKYHALDSHCLFTTDGASDFVFASCERELFVAGRGTWSSIAIRSENLTALRIAADATRICSLESLSGGVNTSLVCFDRPLKWR